ncbi:MAG: hypothetical protein OEY09_10955 [Gammaproteobacteria bacterium]|nr:hypothetical protein [Gammaproteobacteria bacterium]
MTIAVHRKIQYLIIVGLMILLLIYTTDQFSGVPHNNDSAGLVENRQWVSATREKLQATSPEVVVIGNSMTGYGFDEVLFSELSNTPTISIWRKGTASAWFYLALKNLVLAESQPRNLVIIFRDNILTRPDLRVWGMFKKDIDALAQVDSRLLDELAYLNHKSAEYYFTNYLPLYAERSLWSDKIKFVAEEFVSQRILNIEVSELMVSLNNLFTYNGIKYREMGNQSYYQSTRLDPDDLRFSENVKDSFLPHIVDLCKQHGINLVVVRFQRLVDLERLRDTELVEQYIADLADYAQKHNFVFIDSTDKNWLDRRHYSVNDHLVEAGKERFTRELFREFQERNMLGQHTGK